MTRSFIAAALLVAALAPATASAGTTDPNAHCANTVNGTSGTFQLTVNAQTTLCFVPDPEHRWDGSSLPKAEEAK